MQPIIYVWPSTTGTSNHKLCTAMQWHEENVIHVRFDDPENLPPGKPVSCNVFGVAPDSTLADCRLQIESSKLAECVGLCVVKGTDKCLAGFLVDSAGTVVDAEVNLLPTKEELYSRSRGLLEGEILADKRVVIIGLGSFGSLIAVELAKAGVGKYCLFDFDRIEPSNIARHACGLQDLGRLKTKAVKDLILQKNPFAEVTTHDLNINECLRLFRTEVEASDLIVSVTDENRSRLNVNQIAIATETKAILGRAITRAAGGDVFRLRPGEGPCLNCVFGAGLLG